MAELGKENEGLFVSSNNQTMLEDEVNKIKSTYELVARGLTSNTKKRRTKSRPK